MKNKTASCCLSGLIGSITLLTIIYLMIAVRGLLHNESPMTLQEFIAGSPDTYSGIIFGVMAIIGFYCGFALRRQYLNHIARFATRHPDLPEDEAQHLGARSFRIKTAKELFKLTYLIPIITYVNEWRIPSTPGDFIFLSIAAIAGILLYGMKKSHVMQSR